MDSTNENTYNNTIKNKTEVLAEVTTKVTSDLPSDVPPLDEAPLDEEPLDEAPLDEELLDEAQLDELLTIGENIYSAAMKDNNDNYDINCPYIKQLSIYRLPFGMAARLDYKYLGVCGEYWREAYDFPKKGDKLSNGTIVKNAGLLTFECENDTEDENETEDEDDESYYEWHSRSDR
jgi:hypothetical protein